MENIKLFDNFIDVATCDHMVQVYERLFENSDKIYDGRKLIRNSKDSEILDFLKIYLPKISEVLGQTYYIRDLLLSIYEPGASLEPHIDFIEIKYKDSLGVLLYLNDDFMGGEIYFTKFDYKYHPSKGAALVFPCNNFKYTHGVTEVTSGIRYTMPLEITLKKELSIYDI